ARSSLTLRQLPNGLTRLTADLHPEAAGFVRSALDAQTAPRRVAFTASAEPDDGQPEATRTVDPRTLAQKRVDALQTMARDFLAHDRGTLAGTAVTMLVTVGLEELRSGGRWSRETAAAYGRDARRPRHGAKRRTSHPGCPTARPISRTARS